MDVRGTFSGTARGWMVFWRLGMGRLANHSGLGVYIYSFVVRVLQISIGASGTL